MKVGYEDFESKTTSIVGILYFLLKNKATCIHRAGGFVVLPNIYEHVSPQCTTTSMMSKTSMSQSPSRS